MGTTRHSHQILLPQVNATEPHWWYVNIGSGNGLVPSGNKPLPEPILSHISCGHKAYGITRPQWVKLVITMKIALEAYLIFIWFFFIVHCDDMYSKILKYVNEQWNYRDVLTLPWIIMTLLAYMAYRSFFYIVVCNGNWSTIGHVTLLAITGTNFMMPYLQPYLQVKSLQFIWSLKPNFQINCID